VIKEKSGLERNYLNKSKPKIIIQRNVRNGSGFNIKWVELVSQTFNSLFGIASPEIIRISIKQIFRLESCGYEMEHI